MPRFLQSDRDPFDPDDPNDFIDRRHGRVQRDVARSRRSRVPTWVYALTLAVVVGAWVAFITLG
jgi:hypothetical protein